MITPPWTPSMPLADISYARTRPDQFENKVLALREVLYHYARRFRSSKPDREDLVQETLLKALQNRHQYKECNSLKSWLCVIMKHHFIDELRTREPLELGDFEHLLIALPDQYWRLCCKDVEKCIDKLLPKHRAALLEVAGGSTYKEAASRIGSEINTIKTWVSRSRRCLLLEMGDLFGPEIDKHRQNITNYRDKRGEIILDKQPLIAPLSL